MQHQPKHYKWISFFAVLLVALSIVTPVLADYLGPNRTVTQTVSVCKVYLYECREGPVGHWKDHKVEDWLCSNESKPWEAYDSSGACHAGNNNHKHWEQEEKTETVTTTYPAATISGSIQNCTVQNGWCVTSPQLSLSANEPVSGYNILLIEGTLNGTSFACQAGETSCSVPLNEGDNNFNYWALSSWGDSSAMGNSTARVDTIAPNVGVDISGASGTNGWYVSPVTVTATGSDPTPGSGVASDLLTTDNATWQPSLVFNEGVHDIAVRVIDNAGHVSDATTTLSVDTTTPSINVSVTGTTGNNGWYKSIVQVSAVADDATSKVGTFQVSIDGAAYQAYTNTMQIPLNDGHHTIRFKAVDKAGNPTETPIQDFYIDTLAPLVDLPRSWQVEKNVIYTAQENLSGLAALRVVIEDEDERYAKVTWDEPVSGTTFSDNIHWNGVFKDKTVAPPGTYLVWVKASDLAGNERFQLGKVTVPEPNYVWILPQANAVPATEEAVAPPAPPAELLEGAAAPSLITPPTTDFGGGATQPGEATKQSLLLTSGTAGASAATSSSGILWGAAAAAAIGAATAYALDATRKRKEAEEVQAAQARAQAGGHAGQHLTKEEKKEQKAKQAEAHDQKVKDREESQSWENPAKEKALLKEQAERDQAYQQQQAMQQAAANAAMDKRVAVKYDAQEQAKWDAQEAMRQTVMDRRVAAKYDAQEQAKWDAKQEAAKMSQAAARNAGMLANLPGYFNSEKQAQQEKSWWEKTTSFVQEKIIQPVVTTVDKYVYQPYIQPAIEKAKQTQVYKTVQTVLQPKNIVPTLLTVALGAGTLQWINNVKSKPDIFEPARTYAQALMEEMEAKHPRTDETRSLSYLWTHPYDAFATGSDFLNVLTSIGASYADAIWQQNPLAQMQIQNLEALEASTCSHISNQGWSNRCTATFYLGAGLTATPFDTALGVLNGLVVDPVSGIVKQFALAAENAQKFPELIEAIKEDGLQGALDFEKELFQKTLNTIANDKQMQSAYFLEGLLLLAFIAAPVAGGIILGMTLKGLMDLDAAVATAQNKKSLIDFVTSHAVRTTVVSSVLILALMATGLGKKALEFRAVEEGLSPSAQWAFQKLSLLEQTRIAEFAIKMKLSPSALEFYLNEAARPGSSLAKLPLVEALRVSSFVDVHGEEVLTRFLPFCDKYGLDPYDILTRPRADGQSLFGLVLGIEDLENPVNVPLKFNLPNTEIKQLMGESIQNPDSKLFSIGYGKDAEIPFDKMANRFGDEYKMSFLSMPDSKWAKYNEARAYGDFWEVNSDAIEWGIEERKIFVLNVDYDLAADSSNPLSTRRFTYAELKLIENPVNNYTMVTNGKYSFFVPNELLDTYENFLPPELLKP